MTPFYNVVNLLLRDVILVNLGFRMRSHCLSKLIPYSHRRETSFAVSDSVSRTDFHTKILKSGDKHRLIKLSVTQPEAEWH